METRGKNIIGFRVLMFVVLFVAAVFGPSSVLAAASPQLCTVGKSCSVGEFLYDDSYQVITSGTCTFTSRYPDGSLYVNAQALTSTTDGWYAHTFTTPSTEGIYRSQICCTTGSDYLCIDKSFDVRESTNLTKTDVSEAVWDRARSSHVIPGTFGEAIQSVIPASSEVASAVWGYSGRTLSSFGSMTSDFWSYTTRSLTAAGLLSGNLATQSDIAALQTKVDAISTDSKTLKQIQKTTKETRLLLEKAVNKPIIENSIQDEASLHVKLKITSDAVKNEYFAVAKTQKALLGLKTSWRIITPDEQLDSINDLLQVIGEPSDSLKQKTLYGMNNWITSSWDFSAGKIAAKNIDLLYQSLTQTQQQMALRRLHLVVFPQTSISSIAMLKRNIGEIGDDELG
ncbi:MAG: hypothetical protein ACMG6E_03885, partial [Candidatus Roizmanbacteria bacterium]